MTQQELDVLLDAMKMQKENVDKLSDVVDQQNKQITWLIANVQAFSSINHGVLAVLGSNPVFIEKLAFAAKHRDARFNGSTMSDELIAEFKTNLRDLLPDQLKHLAD